MESFVKLALEDIESDQPRTGLMHLVMQSLDTQTGEGDVKELQTPSGEEEPSYELGRDLVRRKHFAAAEEVLFRYVRANVSHGDSWSELGFARILQRNYTGAEQAYNRAIKYQANMGDSLLQLGFWHLLGDIKTSEIALKQAVELLPKNHLALLGLGRVHFKKGKNKDAIKCFEKVLEKDPENELTLFSIGQVYLKQNWNTQARDVFKQVISLRPDWVQLFTALGEIYLKKSMWEEAEEFFNKAIELKPDWSYLWESVLSIYMIRKRFSTPESSLAFSKLKELDGQSFEEINARIRKRVEEVKKWPL
ncbi:MAG: tetratricopeptide repeat protein [Candidatus Thorarchaeota archaeon]|jgi:tetratricopeptide (TPR) repeat protein